MLWGFSECMFWIKHTLLLLLLRCCTIWTSWETASVSSSHGGNIPPGLASAPGQTSSWTADVTPWHLRSTVSKLSLKCPRHSRPWHARSRQHPAARQREKGPNVWHLRLENVCKRLRFNRTHIYASPKNYMNTLDALFPNALICEYINEFISMNFKELLYFSQILFIFFFLYWDKSHQMFLQFRSSVVEAFFCFSWNLYPAPYL